MDGFFNSLRMDEMRKGKSTMNSKISYLAAVLLAMLSLVATSASAQDSESVKDENLSIAEALTSGKAHLLFRYRYEFVDQDGFAEDANASTLRIRLNYQTGKWNNWSGFTEFDYVTELLLTDFNSLGGSSPDRGDEEMPPFSLFSQ